VYRGRVRGRRPRQREAARPQLCRFRVHVTNARAWSWLEQPAACQTRLVTFRIQATRRPSDSVPQRASSRSRSRSRCARLFVALLADALPRLAGWLADWLGGLGSYLPRHARSCDMSLIAATSLPRHRVLQVSADPGRTSTATERGRLKEQHAHLRPAQRSLPRCASSNALGRSPLLYDPPVSPHTLPSTAILPNTAAPRSIDRRPATLRPSTPVDTSLFRLRSRSSGCRSHRRNAAGIVSAV
jgi:hypothetical protein